MKKQGKYEEKSSKANPELTQMLELADKDIKTIIIAVVHMFKEDMKRYIKDSSNF